MNTIGRAKERGGTASMIVSSVCNEHRNSDLRADSPIVMRAFNERFEYLQDQRDCLLSALRALKNEATGFIEYADQATHGVTNIRVLQTKIDAANAAIAKAEGSKSA